MTLEWTYNEKEVPEDASYYTALEGDFWYEIVDQEDGTFT